MKIHAFTESHLTTFGREQRWKLNKKILVYAKKSKIYLLILFHSSTAHMCIGKILWRLYNNTCE